MDQGAARSTLFISRRKLEWQGDGAAASVQKQNSTAPDMQTRMYEPFESSATLTSVCWRSRRIGPQERRGKGSCGKRFWRR